MKTVTEALKTSNGFLGKCIECLKDTDPPIFCPICGAQKKEFQNPPGHVYFKDGARVVCGEAERIVVLECACERELKEMIRWYKINLEIYGNEYDTWRGGGANHKKEKHFRAMVKVKGEIDHLNTMIRNNS